MAQGNLKMENILPFFPDFVLIDDFKDELCQVLQQYNDRIEMLRLELDEATKCSENIRLDIRKLKNRYDYLVIGLIERFVTITVTRSCDLCTKALFTRQFYAFACQHVFHFDCLSNMVIAETVRGKRVLELQSRLSQAEQPDRDAIKVYLIVFIL